MLIATFEEIVKTPNLGKDDEGIISKLLGQKTGRHIVIYRMIE